MKSENYKNKQMISGGKQEFFFPDIDGESIAVEAENMAEAEKLAKEKIKKQKDN